MQWNPDESKLQQLCQMFEAASSPQASVQQQVMQMLNQFSQMPDFNMYLVSIFAKMTTQSEVVRQRAGLLLKTNVRQLQAAALPPGMAEHILAHSLIAMQEASKPLRNTAGSILTTMVHKVGFSACGATLDRLLSAEFLGSNHQIMDGSLGALGKICEDGVTGLAALTSANPLMAQQMQSSFADLQTFCQWSAERLLPKIFECAAPQSPEFARHAAIKCLNHFALGGSFNDPKLPQLQAYSTKYLETLGVAASDPSAEITEGVCKGFACIIQNAWPCLTDTHYKVILGFMLKACQRPEYTVRLEALAVWTPCVAIPDTWGVVLTMLPELVPALLLNMVYSDADYMVMDHTNQENDNANVPDCLDDIKPRFAKESKKEKDEEDEGGDGDTAADWTARKEAASSLDNLSTVFQNEITTLVLPHIEQKLKNPNWEHQEAGVLALGAIAVGCRDKLLQFLPAVLEMLFGLCKSEKPLLRSISCWCVSRFAPWICHGQHAQRQQVFDSALKTIMERCLDRNKQVQAAAISAFAVLEETALKYMVPYLNDTVQMFVSAFQLYQKKNLRILYDAIGTLCWAIGADLNQPQLVQALVTPVIQQWDSVPDPDITTLALFECAGQLVANLCRTIGSVIPKFIQRCMRIIREVGQAAIMWEQNPNEFERPDRELMAAAVDLLMKVVEGFGADVPQVLAQMNFLEVLPDALRDTSHQVKCNAFAMVGTCALHCFEALSPCLQQTMPLCLTGLTNEMPAHVSNNVSWAIGEICMKAGAGFMDNYVDVLVPPLVLILDRKEGVHFESWQRRPQMQLSQNVCITLGRVGCVCGPRMAKHITTFMPQWCDVMRYSTLGEEKVLAFKGLCSIIKAAAQQGGGLPCPQAFPQFAFAAISLCPVPQDLSPVISEILNGYKQSLGAQWAGIAGQMPQEMRGRLQQQYGLAV